MTASVGSVLLIAVDGMIRPSRVTGHNGKKLLHADITGHERSISPARPLWISRQCCDHEEALETYWESVLSSAKAIDLPTLWECLASEKELGEYHPSALAKKLSGELADHLEVAATSPLQPLLEDALILAVFGERLHFRLRKGRVLAVSREVLREAKDERRARDTKVRHLEIATRLLGERLSGEAGSPGNEDESAAIADHLSWLARLAVHAKGSSHYKDTMNLVRGLGRSVKLPTHAATQVLIELGEWLPHQNLGLIRSGLPTRHTVAVEESARQLAARAPDLSGRADYRSLLTVAIDDSHTVEVDDAFAIDGDRLLVFIADAAAWVPPSSAVFVEAADRVSTLYLPEARWPMLPTTLGEHQASLLEGEDRLALCYSFTVDPDGELRDFRVERAQLRVDKRLTYATVDAVLQAEAGNGEGLTDAVLDLVCLAADYMEAHAGHRERCGAMTFTRDEVHLQADPKTGEVEIEKANPNGPARELVAEMMVAVCGAAAAACVQHEIPTIYRSQEAPDDPIDRPDGPITDAWQQWNILRRFKPSRLSLNPATHFSLALPAYTQVTSPLRRFQDLVMNHQLAAFARGEQPPFSADDLREMLGHIGGRSSELRSVEHQSRRYWALWYLETHPDTVLSGLVVHEVGRRWVVRVPELALIVTLSPRGKLRRSARIRLRVGDVDARRDHLVLVDM